MGKASRRRGERTGARSKTVAPFAPRPFAELPDEPSWVALRELLPAATATLQLGGPAAPSGIDEVIVATVLPLGWPALRRADGPVLIGVQTGSSSGDASRDLAARIIAAADTEPGTPIATMSRSTTDTPRLQDLVAPNSALTVQLHQGFDFWIEDDDLTDQTRAALEQANESIVPTEAIAALPHAYWVRIGERTFIRHVLAEDEDLATAALARLAAAGEVSLGPDTRLLGAFRACGLLVPVFEVPADSDAAAHEEELAAFGTRYQAATAVTEPLTSAERAAKAGLLSRQVTLR